MVISVFVCIILFNFMVEME